MSGQPTFTARERVRLYDQFNELMALVEPEALQRYSMSWALLASYVDRSLGSRADLDELIGNNPVTVMMSNHVCHAKFITSVIRLRSAPCLIEVAIWVYRSYVARGFSPDYFPAELAAWREAIEHYIRPVAPAHWLMQFYTTLEANHQTFLRLAEEPDGATDGDPLLNTLSERFLDSLLQANEGEAEDLLRRREGAATLPVWWESVVTPALRRVGALWSSGQINVAQEHVATAITQRVLARCFPRLTIPNRQAETMAVVVSPNEQHEVGARLIADALELCGYPVLFTGANTPGESILSLIEHNDISTLLISTTMPYHLGDVQDLIHAIRTRHGDRDLRILVGGQAYAFDERLWETVEADAYVASVADLLDYLGAEVQAPV